MVANIHPPGPKTGYQHSKCYASADENCSEQISREHFLSAALLRQVELNGTAKITGLAWQAPETFNIVPITGLASKMLCERHNNALSPLDAMMDQFSRTIQKFDKCFLPNSAAPPKEERVFAGADIERWMLKCLIGMVASGNLREQLVKPECIDLLYGRIAWPEQWGLYWRPNPGKKIYHSNSIAVETHFHPENRTILAATFVIRGVPLALCLGKPGDPKAFGTWRPDALVFRAPKQERTLIMEWDTLQGQAIFLDRSGTYDGPPPDWKEWEQKL